VGSAIGRAPERTLASSRAVAPPTPYRRPGDENDLPLDVHSLSPPDRPASLAELDDWVARQLLDPASAMFREGNVLLAEEPHVTDTAAYFSVLAAIGSGRTRQGEIAAAVGRSEGALTHPLNVLVAAGLVDALRHAVKQKRTTYYIAEPVLRLHQLVIAPNEERLTRHHGKRVWAEVGRHRLVTHLRAALRAVRPDLVRRARLDRNPRWASKPRRVNLNRLRGTQDCHENGRRRDRSTAEPRGSDHRDRRGQMAGDPCGIEHLERLEQFRDLLHADRDGKLLVFSRSGFTTALTDVASRSDVELIDVERLYSGD
jgi:DNA-binding HxlR family transcriptional regulator